MTALFQDCPSCGGLEYLTKSDVQKRRVSSLYQQAVALWKCHVGLSTYIFLVNILSDGRTDILLLRCV